MSIQFHCSNATCGQVLTVQDEFAGKKGRCPTCGIALDIPALAPPNKPGAGNRRSADNRTPREQPLLEAQPIDASDRYPPARKSWEADADGVGSGPGRQGADHLADLSKIRKRGISAGTGIASLLGIFGLVLLSFLPQLNWLYVHDNTPRQRGMESRTDDIPRGPAVFDFLSVRLYAGTSNAHQVGTVFLVYSAFLGVFALLALALASALQEETAAALVGASSSAAAAWGVTALLWLLGFCWKAFMLGARLNEGGMNSVLLLPGVGLALGLLAAVLVIGAFSYLATRRRKAGWLIAAGGIGVMLGILLIILNVKPWNVSPFPARPPIMMQRG